MKSRNSFKTLNELYHIHDSKQFWKLVRRRRLNGNDPSSDINLQTLVDHYTKKFAPPRNINDTIRSSQQCVDDKINNLTLHDQQITQTMVKQYICKLKLNCSPANDGITAEHLLYGIDSNIPHQVANMLSLCIKYQGRTQDLGGGGGQEFFFSDLGICMSRSDMLRMAKPCALLGGFGGMLPRENFLKRYNLVRFRVYFDQILSLFFSKIAIFYIKNK